MFKNKKRREVSRRAISTMLCILLCLSSAAVLPSLFTAMMAPGWTGGDGYKLKTFESSDPDLMIIAMEDENTRGNVGVYRAVYCIDRRLAAVDGDIYNTTFDEALWNGQVYSIMDNGFKGEISRDSGAIIGGSMFNGTKELADYPITNYEEAYIATQLAIWFFTNPESITEIEKEVATLSQGAQDFYKDLIAEAAFPKGNPFADLADITMEMTWGGDYRGDYFQL